MQDQAQVEHASNERMMQCQEFCLVSKRVYDLPDDVEPSLLALSDIDGDSYNELLIADISGQVIIAKGHAMFTAAERCPLPGISCLVVMEDGEASWRKYIVLICSDGDCIVFNSPAFDYDLHTWVASTASSCVEAAAAPGQDFDLLGCGTLSRRADLQVESRGVILLTACRIDGKVHRLTTSRRIPVTSTAAVVWNQTLHAVHSLDLLSFNSYRFLLLGFIEGQVEVWRLQEETAAPGNPKETNPAMFSLKFVPGDEAQPQPDSRAPVMQPVCVKATSDGTFVSCCMSGQFAVGQIETNPHPFWQTHSSAETPDMLAYIDHSTITAVDQLFQEQFVQSEHAEGPPYILNTPQQEPSGWDTPARGRNIKQQPFDVTTMVGWNGWTYFLSQNSDVLPLFDANLILKAPVKSYVAGNFGFEYASVQLGAADDADADSSFSLSLASEVPLIHVSSGVETQSQHGLRFAQSDSVNSSVYAKSQVLEAVTEAQSGKLTRMKSNTSFREGSARQLGADDRPADDTSSTISRQIQSVMHNESCIVYGYARSVAVVRCLHSHLSEAFAALDDSVQLPLHLLTSIYQLSLSIQSEAQLEKLPGSISNLLSWIQQGDRLSVLDQYIQVHSRFEESEPDVNPATAAVIAHVIHALLVMSPHDVLQARSVLQPPDRKGSDTKEAMRRVVSAPAFADLTILDSDDEDAEGDENNDDEDEDAEEAGEDEDQDHF